MFFKWDIASFFSFIFSLLKQFLRWSGALVYWLWVMTNVRKVVGSNPDGNLDIFRIVVKIVLFVLKDQK